MGKPRRNDKISEGSDGGAGGKRQDELTQVKKPLASSTTPNENGKEGPSPGCSSCVMTRTQNVEENHRVIDKETMIKVTS